MGKRSRPAFEACAGVDLGDRESKVVVLEWEDEEELERAVIRTTEAGLERFFGGRARMRVVIEVGTHSAWVEAKLAALGHEVVVADARWAGKRVRGRRKNDWRDAEELARKGITDLVALHPIQQRSGEARLALGVMRTRDALVRARTELINHVRCMVKGVGMRLPSWSADCFGARVGPVLPVELQSALPQVVEEIAALTQRIHVLDQQLETIAWEQFPVTTVVRQIRGVGLLTSLAFVLTVEDPHRFRRSRNVGAYFGLVPGERASGAYNPELPISKAGDVMVRRLLVGAGQYILGPFGEDCDLRRHGLRIAGTGGKSAKKRAVCAVARKLAVLMLVLWKTGQPYEPLYSAQRRAA